MKSFSTLACDVHDRVLTITLNRPERRNTFTVQMAEDLVEAFTQVNFDDGIGAVIVTGAGKSFCAGMDLSVGGNVFGLDESLRPTLRDLRQRLHEPSIERGVRDTGGLGLQFLAPETLRGLLLLDALVDVATRLVDRLRLVTRHGPPLYLDLRLVRRLLVFLPLPRTRFALATILL